MKHETRLTYPSLKILLVQKRIWEKLFQNTRKYFVEKLGNKEVIFEYFVVLWSLLKAQS